MAKAFHPSTSQFQVYSAYGAVPLKSLKAKYADLLSRVHYMKKGKPFSRKESYAVVAAVLLFGWNFDAVSDLMSFRSAKSIRNHYEYVKNSRLRGQVGHELAILDSRFWILNFPLIRKYFGLLCFCVADVEEVL